MKIVPNTKIKVGYRFYSITYKETFIITERLVIDKDVQFKYESINKPKNYYVGGENDFKEALDKKLIQSI